MLRFVLPLLAISLLPLVASPAQAAGYTLADVVTASRQGLPESVVLGMVDTPAAPWSVDGEVATQLLRAGVSPTVIRALSGGAHPAPIEIEAAKLPGPVWGEAPVAATMATAGEPAPPPSDQPAPPPSDQPAPPSGASTRTLDDPQTPSEYQRMIAAEARPAGRRGQVTNLHGERFTAANHAMLAGVTETALGLGILASLAPSRGDASEGLHLAGTGLCLLGTGSVVAGSLVAADALRDDGYRVSPVTGWIGVGAWGTGVLLYGGNTLVQGEPEPYVPGAFFLTGATLLGGIQGALNLADRRREIRLGSISDLQVTPLAQAPGLALSGTW